MQNAQHKAQETNKSESVQKTAESQQVTSYKCSNCGAAHSENDKFCSECGMGLKGNSCTHCGAATKPEYEICPECGRNLQAELCSFCGGEMDADSAFCPECGNPRTGIICGQCQTLNFRSFCRKCNAPLNEQAQQALAAAKSDPKFQKAVALAEELAELEEFLLSQPEDEVEPPEIPELSEENRQLIDQYKDLLSTLRGQKPQEKTESPKPQPETQPKAQPKAQIKLSINIASKAEAMAKYKEKLAEMQETLASMIPDAGMTPQMQRDYYSARKVEIVTKTKTKIPLYWVCNAYGCQHYQPNECAEPFKGGNWVYQEIEEATSTWVNQ